MRFVWDARKSASNLAKHGISFDQAIKAFDDPNAVYRVDPEHSDDELREKLIGRVDDAGVILVVFTEKDSDVIRIVSAREATRKEKRIYAETQETPDRF